MFPNFGLRQFFFEEHITMSPNPKNTHLFDLDYNNIKDKRNYLWETHCKYNTIPLILSPFSSIILTKLFFSSDSCIISLFVAYYFYDTNCICITDKNKHLWCKHYKYKLPHSNIFIIFNNLPYLRGQEHFHFHLNPSFNQNVLLLLARIYPMKILRCYPFYHNNHRLSLVWIPIANFSWYYNWCPPFLLLLMGSWCWHVEKIL